MNISRRAFLGGSLALVAVTVAAKYQFAKPRLRMDGIHDDADGWEAMVLGEPFVTDAPGVIKDGIAEASWIVRNGILLMSRPVLIAGTGGVLDHCEIRFSQPTSCALFVKHGTHGATVTNCSIRGFKAA